ncbi:hypothetical protein ACTXT7_013051 [Hymenolepis weldensis]
MGHQHIVNTLFHYVYCWYFPKQPPPASQAPPPPPPPPPPPSQQPEAPKPQYAIGMEIKRDGKRTHNATEGQSNGQYSVTETSAEFQIEL